MSAEAQGELDARGWLDLYAEALGIDSPTEEQVETLLALAGVAAHASERQAAPVSCWLAAIAGVEPAEALARARALADRQR
jgi:hypothetical protein